MRVAGFLADPRVPRDGIRSEIREVEGVGWRVHHGYGGGMTSIA